MSNWKGFECNNPISKETSKFSHEKIIKDKITHNDEDSRKKIKKKKLTLE